MRAGDQDGGACLGIIEIECKVRFVCVQDVCKTLLKRLVAENHESTLTNTCFKDFVPLLDVEVKLG